MAGQDESCSASECHEERRSAKAAHDDRPSSLPGLRQHRGEDCWAARSSRKRERDKRGVTAHHLEAVDIVGSAMLIPNIGRIFPCADVGPRARRSSEQSAIFNSQIRPRWDEVDAEASSERSYERRVALRVANRER